MAERLGTGVAALERAESAEVGSLPGASATGGPQRRRWSPSRVALGAFLAGLFVTAALSVTTLILYNRNEQRLLNLRAREVGLVLTATVPTVQTPLASGAALADATGGNAAKFRAFMKPFVGPGRQFSSVSLWPLGTRSPRPLVQMGATGPPAAALASRVLSLARRPGALNLTGMLSQPHPSLGFEYTAGGGPGSFAVYAENPLPANRRSKLDNNSAFSDLNYALYLGRSKSSKNLLLTTVKTLPVRGLQAADAVPFGSNVFTLVVTPRRSQSGGFFHSLPWIVAFVGVLVSLLAALLTERLARGRRRAEELARRLDRLATETQDRYIEQRSIAQTLQHALLPDRLPEMRAMQVDALYVPAQAGGDVGGDWYDLVPIGEGQALLVIGDVSGHGVEAATTMALVRHATLAYIAQDPHPGVVLDKLSRFVRGRPSDYFATVLCALIDVEAHRLTIASAGHLAPLLLDGGKGEYVKLRAEAPIGFPHKAPFPETTVTVPAGATLLAFTDGLVERRGEILDAGLARLRDIATSAQTVGQDLLARLAEELTSEDHRDDTALVSIRWQS